jgi:hypothetical protein
MAEWGVIGSNLGSVLNDILMAGDIVPGAQPSYQTCKALYIFHPLGKKMADSPITMAMGQRREITVPDAPDRVVEAFVAQWRKIGADRHIANLGSLARVYGISSLGIACEEVKPSDPFPFEKAADLDIAINVWDPLNTAGSLVLNQDPNAIDFQKHRNIRVNGVTWAANRTVTLMHENPIYIEYTSAAFGFVGRSVYQRALFPMKSFIQSMKTDDLVCIKAGVIIAKLKQAGSIITNTMQAMFGLKRSVVKEAEVGNVISVGESEAIETLNMQNLDGAFGQARKDVLENCAAAADMPAIILNNETFAEGFGEGSEDAKYVAKFVESIREWLAPGYSFFDNLVQHRAWNPKFYESLQKEFPDRFKGITFEHAFFEWREKFTAVWPSLLIEPESEQAEAEERKMKQAVAIAEVILPVADPVNKANVVQWLADNISENKKMFAHPLIIDFDALKDYVPPSPVENSEKEPQEPAPFSSRA